MMNQDRPCAMERKGRGKKRGMGMKRFRKAVGKFCVLSSGTLALLAGGLAGGLLATPHLSAVWYAVGGLCAAYAAAIVLQFVRAGVSHC